MTALDRLHGLAAGGVLQAEMHAHRPHRGDMIVAEEGFRRREPDEFDAFLLRVLHLAHRSGHVRLVAPVQAFHRFRALPGGGAHAVHRGIAAADHHDVLAARIQRAGGEFRHRVAQIVPVGSDQVIQRRHDAGQAGAGSGDVARLVDASGDQDGIVLGAQFGKRSVGADGEIQPEAHAAFLQQLPPPQDDFLFQFEVGDAVDQQSADTVVAVVDGDLIAEPAQLLRRREAAGAGADDADRLRQFPARLDRPYPALLEGGVGDIAFDRADGDALEPLLDDAVAFAEPVLRADPAADLGEVVGGGTDLVRLFQPSLGGQLQPVRDVVAERAVHRAERYAALAAAAGLFGGLLGGEIAVDLIEIHPAFVGLPLFRRGLRNAHEFQHVLGHDQPFPNGGAPTGLGGRARVRSARSSCLACAA